MNIDIEYLIKNRTKINPDGCWIYLGSTDGNGYGKFESERKFYAVHRLSAHHYLSFDLNSDLHVLHKCDNKKCCNPEHLFIGTNFDNVQDYKAKGNQLGRPPQTHCIHGHEFTEENTLQYPSNGYIQRVCVTCMRNRFRKRKEKLSSVK